MVRSIFTVSFDKTTTTFEKNAYIIMLESDRSALSMLYPTLRVLQLNGPFLNLIALTVEYVKVVCE